MAWAWGVCLNYGAFMLTIFIKTLSLHHYTILLFLISLSKRRMVITYCLIIYFFIFPSVSLDELEIEPFPKPSFLVKKILKNMASTFKFKKQKQEQRNSEHLRRNSCYHSFCLPETIQRQNIDGFKRFWYSYAF